MFQLISSLHWTSRLCSFRVINLSKHLIQSFWNCSRNLAIPSTPNSLPFSSQIQQKLLRFYSWVTLFSLSPLFMLHLLSWDPFVMLTITTSLSWDPLLSPYTPFNPYAVPCTTTGQGVLFTYLFLVMDDYSFSQFSCICCVFLLLILLSITFHDLPFLLSRTFYSVSIMFFRLLSRSPLEYMSPHLCTYPTLLICTIYMSHLLSWVTCSKA